MSHPKGIFRCSKCRVPKTIDAFSLSPRHPGNGRIAGVCDGCRKVFPGKRRCQHCTALLPMAEYTLHKKICDECSRRTAAVRAERQSRRNAPPKPRATRWTEADMAVIRQAVEANATAISIRRRLSRLLCTSSIRRMMRIVRGGRLFNPEPNFWRDRAEWLRQAYCVEGKSKSQIARELGVTKGAVTGAIDRHVPDKRRRLHA